MAISGRSAAVTALAALVVIGVAALALSAIPASDSPLTYRGASRAAQVLGIGAGTVTTRDPFLDVYCWRQCSDNPLLVHAAPDLARAFVVAGLVSSIAIGGLAVGVVVWRIVTASRVGRAVLAPLLMPAGLVAAA